MRDNHVRARPIDTRIERCANVDRLIPIDDKGLPDIVMPPLVTARFLWLPFASGLLSAGSFWCGAFDWGPGLVFGLLVVLPWCHCARFHPINTIIAVTMTPVAYHLAVLSLFAGWPGMIGAGAVGSGIMLTPLLLLGPVHARRGLLVAMFVGWAAGLLVVILLFVMKFCAYFLLIAVWQWFVGTAMTTALLGKGWANPN